VLQLKCLQVQQIHTVVYIIEVFLLPIELYSSKIYLNKYRDSFRMTCWSTVSLYWN